MTARDVLDQAVDAWNRKDEGAFVGLAVPETTITASGGIELRGLAGMRQFYGLWLEACPDNVIRYYNVVVEGDRLIGEASFTGTQTGILHAPSGDLPPTRKRLSVDYVGVFRMSGARISSLRIYFDVMDMLAQLGHAGAPAAV